MGFAQTACCVVIAALMLTASMSEAGRPLRLLLNDWVTNFRSETPPTDYDDSLAVGVNFLMAAKHINDRRSDILPVLRLDGCNRNVSVATFIDDGGEVPRLIYAIADYAKEIDAIAGIGASSTGVFTALMGSVYAKPIVSHWASSPALSDKTKYPFFARVTSSDATVALKVVRLLCQLGYNEYALLHIDVSVYSSRSKRSHKAN